MSDIKISLVHLALFSLIVLSFFTGHFCDSSHNDSVVDIDPMKKGMCIKEKHGNHKVWCCCTDKCYATRIKCVKKCYSAKCKPKPPSSPLLPSPELPSPLPPSPDSNDIY